jgi:predicted nucleic acid-binding protein
LGTVILIDSNVLIDIFAPDQSWYQWSSEATAHASLSDFLVINQIGIAEIAPGFATLDVLLSKLAVFNVKVLDIDDQAAFAAGKAFSHYRARRRAGDERRGTVLPDFLIGGHAKTLGATILTRDPRFYRAYFPDVPLITPEKDEA